MSGHRDSLKTMEDERLRRNCASLSHCVGIRSARHSIARHSPSSQIQNKLTGLEDLKMIKMKNIFDQYKTPDESIL